jgi:transcriptional regulator with XRE-family HTH domain
MITKEDVMRKARPAQQVLDELRGGPLTFGAMLRSLRMCDELTLAEFSKKLDISVAHLCDVEKGRRAVSAKRAARWAKLLGHPVQLFVQLALQSELDEANIKLKVVLNAA